MNVSSLFDDFDTSSTNTSTASDWKSVAYVAAGIPILILAIIAIALNGTILWKFCHRRSRLSVNMKFTFSLAASDLWASSLVAFGLLGNSLMPVWLSGSGVFAKNTASDFACILLVLEAAKLGAILTSVLHLLTLAANQCFSIVDPIGHKVLVTSKVCKVVLFVLWVTPIAAFLLYFYSTNSQGFRSHKCNNLKPYQMHQFRTVVFCVIATPMFLMIVLYAVIWAHLFQYKRRTTNKLTINGSGHYRHQIQAIMTTTLIVGTFVLSWFPSILLYLLICWDCAFDTQRLNERLVFALSVTKTVLILVKLILNPLIYSCRVRVVLDNSTGNHRATMAGADTVANCGRKYRNGRITRFSSTYSFQLDRFKSDTSDSVYTFNGGGDDRRLLRANADLGI